MQFMEPQVQKFYLKVNLNHFVKVLLLHFQQELILCDASGIHTYRRGLEIVSLFGRS